MPYLRDVTCLISMPHIWHFIVHIAIFFPVNENVFVYFKSASLYKKGRKPGDKLSTLFSLKYVILF